MMNQKKIKRKTLKLFEKLVKVLEPPKQITVSEWADEYRRLSSESSAESGKWRTSRAEYQRAIMDSLADKRIETVVIMSSAQIGKTEIINNALGYYVSEDPAPILLLQPTLEMAKAYSKDRLTPMIRDTPRLLEAFGTGKSRDGSNEILHKQFLGGHITLAGANSPASLASRSIRILLMDEVDRYPGSAGTEGDPVDLARKRTDTFWNRKIIIVSTPTIKDHSKIEKEYENSTQEEWCVPCPVCQKYQPYDWKRVKFDSITMECQFCEEHFTEQTWKREEGKWISKLTDEEKVLKSARGFHINALASPWASWKGIIEKFHIAKKASKAGDNEKLKVFVNTELGELWKEKSDVDEDMPMKLYERREEYYAEVPADVLVLTASVDVQDDRFEIEVVGWGVGEESWGIEYHKIYGNLEDKVVWKQLDDYLSKEFTYANGNKLVISITCIDSGGSYTQAVYKWTRDKEHRRIYAIKGQGPDGAYIAKRTTGGEEKVPLMLLTVDRGKEIIYSRFKIMEPGEGYMHFPADPKRGYDLKYFESLVSEKIEKVYKKGTWHNKWVLKQGVKRNEGLDLRNYATAGLRILNPPLEEMKAKNINGNYFTQTKKVTKRKRVRSKGI